MARKKKSPTPPRPVEVRPYDPYLIPATGPGLVLSDIHLPFHDHRALELAIRYGKKRGVSWVMLNGDTMDCQGPSRFVKKPDRIPFKREVEIGLEFLEHLRDVFPIIPIVWKDGNHEERLIQYLCSRAEELYGLPQVSWPGLLEFNRLRISYVTDKRRVKAGKLNILHGHEYQSGISAPVNPARGLFLRAKGVAMCGHHHQTSEHHEPTIDGKPIGCWSTGCLCDLRPEYMPLNKWNHGFAVVEFQQQDGDFTVQNLKVMDGKVV